MCNFSKHFYIVADKHVVQARTSKHGHCKGYFLLSCEDHGGVVVNYWIRGKRGGFMLGTQHFNLQLNGIICFKIFFPTSVYN